tara:strand:- start:33 stop:179 length:147 start_codon:yes stop_codon:yes gene_type:complete
MSQADSVDEAVNEEEEDSELPVMTKLAVLFVALGQETCGEVMKFLSDL